MDSDAAVSQYELLQEKWSNFRTRFRAPLLNAGLTADQIENATLHNTLVMCTFVAPYTSTIRAAAEGDFQALQTLLTVASTAMEVPRDRVENAWAALPWVSPQLGAPSKTLFWRYVRFFLDNVNTTAK